MYQALYNGKSKRRLPIYIYIFTFFAVIKANPGDHVAGKIKPKRVTEPVAVEEESDKEEKDADEHGNPAHAKKIEHDKVEPEQTEEPADENETTDAENRPAKVVRRTEADAENQPAKVVHRAPKKSGEKDLSFKLSKHPSCAEEVMQLCSTLPKDNNFAVLVCLQDAAGVSGVVLSKSTFPSTSSSI